MPEASSTSRRDEQLALARRLREGPVLRVRTIARPSSVCVQLFYHEEEAVAEFTGALIRLGFRPVPCEIEPPPGAVSRQWERTTRKRIELAHKVMLLPAEIVWETGVPWMKR